MDAREEELIAGDLLEYQEQIDVCLKNKEWAKLTALVRYARTDAPKSLIHTDQALYLHLRECITTFHLRGGDAFSLEKLEELAGEKQGTQWPLSPSFRALW